MPRAKRPICRRTTISSGQSRHTIKATPKDLADALIFAKQGVALDPTYARGHGLLAAIYSYQVIIPRVPTLMRMPRLPSQSARKALELDNNDATILVEYGQVQAQLFSRPEEGLALFDKAIEHNPNLALAWALRGICNGNLGSTAKSISDFEQALRLSPRDPLRWVAQHGLAWAHLMAGRLRRGDCMGDSGPATPSSCGIYRARAHRRQRPSGTAGQGARGFENALVAGTGRQSFQATGLLSSTDFTASL